MIAEEGQDMPEVRATLPVEIHRKLKAEAANEGVHLKQLIAKVLERHAKRQGSEKGETRQEVTADSSN
jgi:hypothetical protein